MLTRDLPNGLRVAAIRSDSLPIAQVRWVFGSGRIHEARTRLGSGLVLQRAMRHGTKNLAARAFAERLDEYGARMAGGVTIDSSIVSISGVSQHLWTFVDMATDVALEPALPEVAAAAERLKALQVHHHEWSQVDNMAALWLARSLYGDHPYGLPRTTSAGLKQTTVRDLEALHQSIVDPHRGLILVVGKIDVGAVVQRLSERFGDLASNTTPVPMTPTPPKSEPKTMVFVPVESAETTTIGLGLPAIARNHEDYTPLRVVNQIFGGSASSRLFRTLRDRLGLSYGAYSALDSGRYAGDLTAYVTLDPHRADQGFTALYEELELMASGRISDEELDHARRFLVGSFPQRASGLAGLSTLATAAWIHDLPDDVWSNLQLRVKSVDQRQAVEMASRWFLPDHATWVVVGPKHSLSSVAARAAKKGLRIVYRTMKDLEDAFI